MSAWQPGVGTQADRLVGASLVGSIVAGVLVAAASFAGSVGALPGFPTWLLAGQSGSSPVVTVVRWTVAGLWMAYGVVIAVAGRRRLALVAGIGLALAALTMLEPTVESNVASYAPVFARQDWQVLLPNLRSLVTNPTSTVVLMTVMGMVLMALRHNTMCGDYKRWAVALLAGSLVLYVVSAFQLRNVFAPSGAPMSWSRLLTIERGAFAGPVLVTIGWLVLAASITLPAATVPQPFAPYAQTVAVPPLPGGGATVGGYAPVSGYAPVGGYAPTTAYAPPAAYPPVAPVCAPPPPSADPAASSSPFAPSNQR